MAQELRNFILEPVTASSSERLLAAQSLSSLLKAFTDPSTEKPRVDLIVEVLYHFLRLPENLNKLLVDDTLIPLLIAGINQEGVTRLLALQFKSIVDCPLQTLKNDSFAIANAVLIRQSGLWSNALPLLLNNEDTTVGATAAAAIKQSLKWDKMVADLDPRGVSAVPSFEDVLLSQDFLTDLEIILDIPTGNDSHKFRLFGLAVELGELSSKVFEAFRDRGIYKMIFDVYNSGDFLLMLNCAELAIQLCSYSRGLHYSAECGAAKRFTQDLADDMMDDCLRIGLLDVVTQIVELLSEDERQLSFSESDYAILFAVTQAFLEDRTDSTKLTCGLSAWARLTTSLRSWAAPSALSCAAAAISHPSASQVSVAAMQSWASVIAALSCYSDWPEAVLRSITDCVATDVVRQVIIIRARPFDELRPHLYALLTELCKEQRYIEVVIRSEAKRDLVININSETLHDAVVAKYSFIVELLRLHTGDKSWLESAIGAEALLKLKQYAASGNPFKKMSTGLVKVAHLPAG